MNRLYRIIMVLMLAVLLCSCTALKNALENLRGASKEQQEVQVESFFTHQVRYQGETLGLIAQWYTGSSGNWRLLVAANEGLDIHRIKQGDTIRIPASLVVKKDPLPRSALPESKPGQLKHFAQEVPDFDEPALMLEPDDKFAAPSPAEQIEPEVPSGVEQRPAPSVVDVEPDTDSSRSKTREELLREMLEESLE